ncbi:MAG: hypothetical protein KF841_09180 [Phycisphaerae bacterium]|nr:hypothetical protein [Phycisphaerae bacterium]
MVFLGYSEVLLDAKNRLAVPAKFRRCIDPEKHGTNFVLTRGRPTNTIWVYPEKSFIELAGGGERSLIAGDDQVRFDQVFFARGEVVEPDGQGRILLPDRLIKGAGLGRELVVSGVRDHMEIWSKDAFEKHTAELESRFEELQARAREVYREQRRQPGQSAGEVT